MDANKIAEIIDKLIDDKTKKSRNRRYHRGVVESVNGQRCDIYIEGNTVATENVLCIGSYTPAVGDKVLIVSLSDSGLNRLVLGGIDPNAATRNKPRISSASSGNISPDAALYDFYIRTAMTAGISIAAPTNPQDGQKMIFRLKSSSSTARSISWNTSTGGFRAVGVSLPTAINNKWLYVGAVYNVTDNKWDVIAATQEL